MAISILGFLVACDFEESIVPVDWQSGDERRFGGVTSRPVGPDEATQADIDRLVEELFDPFNLPGDRAYRGSVYEQMDMILKGAYEHYGYNLAELAIRRQDNPITEDEFLDYLIYEGLAYVVDPETGEELSVFDWLVSRLIGGGEGIYSVIVDNVEPQDPSNPLNYERNYLAAIYDQYPGFVLSARQDFRKKLVDTYKENPAGIYEYLNNLDLFGIQ